MLTLVEVLLIVASMVFSQVVILAGDFLLEANSYFSSLSPVETEFSFFALVPNLPGSIFLLSGVKHKLSAEIQNHTQMKANDL